MLFDIALAAAALGCGLVSGFLLGFAVVAMPGLGTLGDREFVRSFQAMDRVIQDRQPVFMVMWVGSVVAVIGALLLGVAELSGGRLVLLVVAAAVYLLGVQLPTAAVNIPMNNRVQRLDLDTAEPAEVSAERARFEARWNRWNALRAGLGVLSTALLLVVLATG